MRIFLGINSDKYHQSLDDTLVNFGVGNKSIHYPNAPWCWNMNPKLCHQNHPVMWVLMPYKEHMAYVGTSLFSESLVSIDRPDGPLSTVMDLAWIL